MKLVKRLIFILHILNRERTDESKKIPQECHKSMDAEENLKSTTKKPRIRPTQSYYIPPAQRSASKK